MVYKAFLAWLGGLGFRLGTCDGPKMFGAFCDFVIKYITCTLCLMQKLSNLILFYFEAVGRIF
jgi:hypothetical protein